MFRSEDIQARLRQRPFQPVRIIASEGMHFDIHHPDLVFVGRRDLTIGTPDPDSASIYDGVIRVALVQVVALEDLPTPSSSTSNGASGQ